MRGFAYGLPNRLPVMKYREETADAPVKVAPLGQRAIAWGEHEFRAVGHRLDDCDGRRVGVVDAVLVGRVHGESRYLLVHDRHEHHRVVPVTQLVVGAGRASTPYSRATIESGSLLLNQDGVLDAHHEAAVNAQYSLRVVPPAEWDRRVTVSRAQLDPGDPSRITWSPGPDAEAGAPS